jgi:phosphomannomutase
MTIPIDLRARAEAWAHGDPDPGDRQELLSLLATAGTPGEAGALASAEIRDRFAGRLVFGTAGLRGAVGAGPNRMNRAVVRATTAALAGWLLDNRPDAAGAGVVVGCDARHRSAQFADETAAVLTGAGIRVHLLPRPGPTPLLAFAVRHLPAAAGVMITASHNPPADNGYKLYLADGAQIVPPVDAEIEARIAGLGPVSRVPAGSLDGPLVTRHGGEVADSYLAAIIAAVPPPPPGPARDGLRTVYTPLHGVAGRMAVRAITQAGFPAPRVVAAQAEPDPDFPTVAFPNPEEPGALDLALAQAREAGAGLVIASDPDGDRLAVAVPAPGGHGWQALTGDQVGSLLGAFLLERTGGGQRLAATTVVSSTMLSKIAAAAGAGYAETLTGFKWIMRAGGQVPGSRLVYGYEEALGYAVTPEVVRDKDGIGAALAILSLAAAARAAGQSLLDRWDALEAAHGVHLTAHLTVPIGVPSEVMARLRASPPGSLGGMTVTAVTDLAAGSGPLPPSDVLSYHLAGARAVIRPSGTEPKLKAYLEVVEEPAGRPLAAARQAAADRLAPLRAAVTRLMAAGGDRPAAAAP